MKKILLALGGLAAVVVLGFGALVAMQPAHTHVERSRVMAATPADVFPFANDLRLFVSWNPWARLDPSAKIAFSSEQATGPGAWYTWDGNDQMGSGKMTIDATTPNALVTSTLHFATPFEATAQASFKLAAVDGGTQVTWGFDSDTTLMGKVMGVFISMDDMLGPDYERGLANLEPMAVQAAQARLAAEQAPPVEGDGAAAE